MDGVSTTNTESAGWIVSTIPGRCYIAVGGLVGVQGRHGDGSKLALEIKYLHNRSKLELG